ncbi:MAG: ATPase [Spirochaetales bacterium]|nr:ATPase [Spirochaetales bacterium]
MNKQSFKQKIIWGQIILVILILMFTLGSVTTTFAQETNTQPELTKEKADVTMFALVAAAVAFGFGALGAGFAIANIGAAAMGAIGERPEIAGQALLFVALADGIAIFGFITALMILGKV